MYSFSRLFVAFSLCACAAFGAQAEKSPEDFHIELTGSAWLVRPTGTVQSEGTAINLFTLGVEGQQPRFDGRLIWKPGRKHRFIIEGSPLSFSGRNTLDRSFVFQHHTYDVSQTVSTDANMNYVFAGYQYDPWSSRFGHLGFQIGAAYVGLQGSLVAIQSGVNESRSYQAPVPLIGTEYRIFPIPRHKIVQIEGMVRGLPAGGLGYFIEGGISGGLRFGPVGILAGYRDMFANLHRDGYGSNGGELHVKGPIFSAQYVY